jgi:predicted ATPase/DNA-binding SARP family transcriptional activator/tetratricopeptide (TPR) repeat protein
VRIGILGPLEAWDAAGRAVPLGGTRLRHLLIRLAIDAGRPVAADRLAEDLWPDGPPAEAANALQALVSRLRRAVGREAIEYGPGGYGLAAGRCEVDAAEFERLVAAGRGGLADGEHARAAGTLRRALGLWRGPALTDARDAPFAAAAITRLEELRLAAVEDRIEADLWLGRGAGLVPEAEELVAEHPLRERLRGQLMRALYAAGRQADALAAYQDARRLLADQLGVDPSPALAGVQLAILRGEAGPPTAAPAAWRRSTNLPAQLTSFVGRDDELRQVAELLASARLVTLTGPGGAGKTRLSIEASAGQLELAPDGVWFVPLAPVRDALDVPQAVLTAMGLPETGHLAETVVPPLDRLADALAGQQTLLVLDNCEHLVDTVAGLADRVLADAPRVRILATSREPLGLTGEMLCPVPSLRLPPQDATAEDAVTYPAVRLFADRAAAVRPGFAVGADTVEPVVRICRALDGIPLAIELAAARLRALTPEQVADRLDDRFRLLSVGSRAALPRHQTLRAIVDWSWDLLDEAERTALRRLSVFSGGATPDSAEQVCALGGDRAGVIDVIASLADKSLVVVDGDPRVRYRLLETVRAYAAERLAEAGEQDRVRAAHAAYFLDLAERADPELRGPDQLRWLATLAAEHDNCTGALRHAVATGDGGLGVRLVAALAWFWMLRDYDSEAVQWAREVHEVTGGTPPPGQGDAHAICEFMAVVSPREEADFLGPVQVADALRKIVGLVESSPHPLVAMAAPVLAVLTGDQDQARRHLAALGDHPEPWTRAAQQMFRGHLAVNNGQIEQGAPDLAAALASFREIGDRWGMIVCLTGLAEVALARGRPAEAISAMDEAQGYTSEDFAGPWGETMCVHRGRARARLGDVEGARADFDRGLRTASRTGNRDDEATAYVELSELARAGGDLTEARRMLDRALAIAEPIAQRPDICAVAATAFSRVGCVCEQEGDLEAAAGWHAKGLAALATEGVILLPVNPQLAVVVEGIAALAAARGELTRAVELLGLAHKLQGFSHPGNPEVARVRAAAGTLDGAAFDAAFARGRELTRDDALALTP